MDDVYIWNADPPIVVAARTWNVALMRTELAAGADPHLRTGLGNIDNSPLIVLILRNTIRGIPKKETRDLVECVRLLLEAGADPCAMDDSGWTAVYFAALYDHHESLAVLLEAGAGAVVNTPIGAGWTPLAQAAQSGHLECVELLLAAGADVELNVRNDALGDVSPLELAISALSLGSSARRTLIIIIPILLRAGATIPPDTQDRYLLKVRSAGGWERYERACRARLAKILARVVFPRLPTDTVSHVVHFAFHTGYY